MDRTGKIGVALALAVFVGWWFYELKNPLPVPPGANSPTPALAGASPSPHAASGTAAPEAVKPAGPAPTPEPVLPEQTQEIDGSSVNFTFTNHGGGIARAQLRNDYVDDQSKQNIVLNDYGSTPIGAISDQPGIGADASYTTGTFDKESITYQRTTPEQVQITKKFTVPTAGTGVEQFLATLDLTFTNRSSQAYKSDGYYIYLGSAAPIHQHDIMRYISMDWYVGGKANVINVIGDFSASKIPFFGHPEKTEYTGTGDAIPWAAVYNQYFTTIITSASGAPAANRVWATRFPVDIPSHQSGAKWFNINPPGTVPQWYAIHGALGMPGFELKPGAEHTQQFQIYVGRRQNAMLEHLGQGQSEMLHMGYSGPINKGLLWLLIWIEKALHGFTGKNSYAVAIILLTIAIKLALWPLQNRSTQSMRKMQSVAPKMNDLREKYKDDPTKYNTEMMKVYKAHGINPLAGCLPMFIQLPVFVGFYSMLGSAIELRNSTFFWVHDLSQPDTVGHLFGYSINVLPLCMAATSAWMMAMTPKSGDAATQRTMYIMPVIFLYICYTYASGLALYMMVSNLFSVIQFIVTKKQTPAVPVKAGGGGKKR